MKRWRAPLLVGVMGVIGGIAFILLFGTVKKQVVSKGEGYIVHADFDDVSGLASHSRVTMAGIPVGAIDSISLKVLEDGKTKARVFIRIKKDILLYKGLPRQDGEAGTINGATITRRTATLLGDYYLEISPGFMGEVLKDGDAIPNVVGEAGLMALTGKLEKVSELFPKLKQIADDVGVITDSLSKVVGGPEGRKRLEDIAEDAKRTAEYISQITKDVQEFVGRETRGGKEGRLGRILGNVERFSYDAARFSQQSVESLSRSVRNIEEITTVLKEALNKKENDIPTVVDAIQKLHGTLENLDIASRHLASIASKIDAGQGTVGRLINDDQVLKKTEAVIGDIESLVKSVSRLETQVGLMSEFYFMEKTVKNYVTLRLQPDKTKYYQFQIVFDPRGKTSYKERLTISNDPSKPPTLSERVTETTKDVKFSFEFARKLYFLTGRFGLIESTGGIGLDAEFLKDSLKLSFDLFDFSADRYPRLRALFTWEFIKHFYISGGVDDIFNYAGRDYFAGIGFRFTDNDLKALLITAPSVPIN